MAHLTPFELRTFGTQRMSDGRSRSVLRHLRSGCAACIASLSPNLIPWLDDAPAAEALGADPGRWGATLVREIRQAAARAARAAARDRSPAGKPTPAVRALMARIEAEGPAMISRLPRGQRGAPAIRALLLLTGTLGRRDPRLRLQLAELAHDLAATARPGAGDASSTAALRDQAGIELANAYRVVGQLAGAQELLGVVAERRVKRRFDTPLDARWLEIQGMVINDQWRAGAAGTILAASSGILRRHARRTELAVSLLCRSSCSDHAEEHLDAVRHARNALRLLDPEEEPLLTSMAWLDLALGLLRHGEPREALAIVRQNRDILLCQGGARNAGRVRRIEGEALALLGDDDGASRAYDAGVRQFAAIGSRYGMGLLTLRQAASFERLGDREGAQRPALEAADRVADFLDPAELDPAVRLRTFLT